MTLTLYPDAVIIRCDHPECGAEVMSVGGGEVRSLAKVCGWRERDRPMWLDPWFLCPTHKAWRPE